jgi:hypothetical protein
VTVDDIPLWKRGNEGNLFPRQLESPLSPFFKGGQGSEDAVKYSTNLRNSILVWWNNFDQQRFGVRAPAPGDPDATETA